jgi:protein-ribulosamine 3-kinase
VRLPEALQEQLERWIGPIRSCEPVGGGCIGETARVEGERDTFFLKHQRDAPTGFFRAEAAGLEALRAAGSRLRVPDVIAYRDQPGAGPAWILLEWLEPASPGGRFDALLGEGLAHVHSVRAEAWGAERDGFIGPLPQVNRAAPRWEEFWDENRLAPQLEIGRKKGWLREERDWYRLRERLPVILSVAEDEGPRLLHGDLWSGNVLATAGGAPALVDPSSYHGHREVDLAMTELFGGFGEGFQRAYRESLPLDPGYEIRKQVYQLYYLLVHVNLFGPSYLARTLSTLQRILGQT